MPDFTGPGGQILYADANFPPDEGGWGGVTPFRPVGASHNGVTDDTQSIIDCTVAAVNAAIADGTYLAVVQFDAGIYQCNQALIRSALTKTNAQIPLPLIADTTPKVTLVWLGAGFSGALAHWNQTSAPLQGTVIRSGLTAQPYNGTWGPPAIIGGPTIEQGYGAAYNGNFSNMCFVMDGITLAAPLDMTLDGINAIGVAEMAFGSVRGTANEAPGSFTGYPTAGIWAGTPAPNNYFATFMRMPGTGNNALATIEDLSVQNWTCAIAPGEHAHVKNFRATHCNISIHAFQTAAHPSHFEDVLIEGCRTFIYGDVQYVASGEPNADLRIDSLRWETYNSPFTKTWFVYDPSQRLVGEVRYRPFGQIWSGSHPIIGGDCSNPLRLKLVDMTAIPGNPANGAIAAPAIPASGVSAINPFHRDAAMTVSGGTVTVITVDGQTMGLTSGTVIVPGFKSWAITYSVAPTVKWTVL